MTKRSTTPGRGSSAQGGGRSPRRSGRRTTAARLALDPLFACLVFAGVGLGTLTVGVTARLVILWTMLLVLWLVNQQGKMRRLRYDWRQLGRGGLIGLGVGLPLVLLAVRPLATAIPILFVGGGEEAPATVGAAAVFVSLVLLAPLAEELFFRDLVQRAHGFWIGLGTYAAAGLLLFLPTAGTYPVVLVAVVGAWSLLGALYSLFYDRFGLATTLTAHMVVNLFLLFVPALVHDLDLFAR